MARTDYFNDPHAPTPNSLVPAASAIVVNESGRLLLLQRRFDNDQWALPGGTMDLGETLAHTAVREVKEVGWVPLDDLDALPMHESTRLRIRHYLDRRALPYIG